MQLTVLGVCGGYPAAGRACSGYLVQAGPASILVDCGSGVMSNLGRHADFRGLDAVVLSHLHGDHMSDLLVLRYAVQRALAEGTRARPLAVYAPPLPEEEFERLRYKQVLELRPIDPDEKLELGGMVFRFLAVPHPVLTYAMAIEHGGRKLVYTGDTGWHDPLVGFAAEADLLLCEATLLEDGSRSPGHLTGREAGGLGRRARARRLLLTHLWPTADWARVLEEAQAALGEAGLPVELAGEGSRYQV
ncbi:MAG: MBL fold metallo-hydrolase [Bacillota bacterium]|nr:MBL fold metallo-hydrolase [Bacillota bacterium]